MLLTMQATFVKSDCGETTCGAPRDSVRRPRAGELILPPVAAFCSGTGGQPGKEQPEQTEGVLIHPSLLNLASALCSQRH